VGCGCVYTKDMSRNNQIHRFNQLCCCKGKVCNWEQVTARQLCFRVGTGEGNDIRIQDTTPKWEKSLSNQVRSKELNIMKAATGPFRSMNKMFDTYPSFNSSEYLEGPWSQ
jgi:hypothetical protein